jgi:hypothetical protein
MNLTVTLKRRHFASPTQYNPETEITRQTITSLRIASASHLEEDEFGEGDGSPHSRSIEQLFVPDVSTMLYNYTAISFQNEQIPPLPTFRVKQFDAILKPQTYTRVQGGSIFCFVASVHLLFTGQEVKPSVNCALPCGSEK